MIRTVLTNAQWRKMEPHCLGKRTDPGRSGADNRLFMEAVLWKARTNSPWRDLPEEFGDWNTVERSRRYGWTGETPVTLRSLAEEADTTVAAIAVSLRAAERRLLEMPASGVVLCERRVISDQDGMPLEHTETRYAAERYEFETTLYRSGP